MVTVSPRQVSLVRWQLNTLRSPEKLCRNPSESRIYTGGRIDPVWWAVRLMGRKHLVQNIESTDIFKTLKNTSFILVWVWNNNKCHLAHESCKDRIIIVHNISQFMKTHMENNLEFLPTAYQMLACESDIMNPFTLVLKASCKSKRI